MTGGQSASILTSLEIAWSNIGSASVDLDLPDIMRHADLAYEWDTRKYQIAATIEHDECYPTSVEIVDLPKDRLAARPLARLDITNRLAYDSFIVAVAPLIQMHLSASVYSSTWWNKRNRLLSPTGRWIKMQRDARHYHARNKSMLMANTDVSSFFEHIEVAILIDDLRRLRAPAATISSIEQFLNAFNNLSCAWGLPQGSDMSGVLANLYLATFDAEIRRAGCRHFRYSDDTYIFGSDWDKLRGVLIRANRTLRHRHLNLATSKTKIVESDAVLSFIEDKEKDAIKYGVKIGAPWASDRLRELFDRAISEDIPNVRDIKFCLTDLAKSKDDYGVSWLLDNFATIPHIAREVLIYLDTFIDSIPRISRGIGDWILSDRVRHYPYAQHHLLIFALRNAISSRDLTDAAWRLLLDRNAETFVREMAARYLGRHGGRADLGSLKQEYQVEENYRVRRALLVACFESHQCSSGWLFEVEKNDVAIRTTARYLQADPIHIPLPATRRPEWR